jgi:hypothetical protein
MPRMFRKALQALSGTVKVDTLFAALIVGLLLYFGVTFFTGLGEHGPRRWRHSAVPPAPRFEEVMKAKVVEKRLPEPQIDWEKPHVAVYSVPAPQDAHPVGTLKDLSESAQAHAIDFLGQSSPGQPHLWSDLQRTLSEPPEGAGDPFKFDRVMVATVSRGADMHTADRMVWTRVFVQPINFQFVGYTVAETENETVKVTSFERTRTRKLSADLGLTIPGLDKADLAPSAERTEKSTGDIKVEYEKLGVDIMPDFLRIIRESETGGNVIGNTKIALSLMTDPKLIWRQYPKDKFEGPDADAEVVLVVSDTKVEEGAVELKPLEASIKVTPQIPLPHCALRARVWMLYEQRHIDRGQEFFEESKQDVSLILDADDKRDVEVVRADDVSPAVWSLQIKQGGEPKDAKPRMLTGRVVDGGLERDLVFTDYGQASRLAHWVRHNPGAAISKLWLSYTPEDAAAKSSIIAVKRAKDVCENADPARMEATNVER